MPSQEVRVRLESLLLPEDLEVAELDGKEGISQLFEFEVLAACAESSLDVDSLLSTTASIVFEVHEADSGWVEVRRVQALICECEDLVQARVEQHRLYILRLVPRLWVTQLAETLDIFLEMTVPEIIQEKLERLGFELDKDFEFRMETKLEAREFVVQYRETDFAFISRLAEHEGISFHFEHDTTDKVIFSDSNNGFAQPSPDSPVPFVDQDELRGVFALSTRRRLVTKHFIQRDYNYRNPGVDLTAVAEMSDGFGGQIVEYGSHFKTEQEGQRIADIRKQEHRVQRAIMLGKATDPLLASGHAIVVSGPQGGSEDLTLLITEVHHQLRQMSVGERDGADFGYLSTFSSLSSSTVFRPKRKTPRPRIYGMVTGIVDGSSEGVYAPVDELGRYRVKFLFDTVQKGEGKASRAVRMMQPHSGGGYGMHFPLRVGTEVLITFLDGDPDRPIIAGTVPNPQTPSPVAKENAHKNVIRTGGANEIDIDDTEDQQRVKISTPHGGSVLQLGSPNAQETGVFLGSYNNITTATGGTANALTTFQSNWNTFNDTWSCHITGFAGPTHPIAQLQFGVDSFLGVANTLSGVCGGIIAVQDGIIGQSQVSLEKKEEDLKDAATAEDEAAHLRAEKRDAMLSCVAGLKNNRALTPESLARLERLEEASAAYEAALQELDNDLGERSEKLQLQSDAQDAGRDTTADSYQPRLDELTTEISEDRRDIQTKKGGLDEAILAVQEDESLDDLSCGSSSHSSCTTSFSEFKTTSDDFAQKHTALHNERADVELAEEQIATTEANQKETRDAVEDVKKYSDAVASASTYTAPLFSLVTSLWGTGMQGYARNVSDFLLTDSVNQGLALVNRIIPNGFGWQAMPPFMMTKPPDMTKPHTNPQYGPIARESWYIDLMKDTKMLPKGGAGMLGLGMGKMGMLALVPLVGPLLAKKFASGAFTEARNIQGSDDHSVLFGLKSVLVNGVEHAALSSGKNLVVTADKRVEVHSRDKTEIAGGDILLTAANSVDVESRGKVLVTCKGPPDGMSPQSSPSRYASPTPLDKDRSCIQMDRGKLELISYDAMGTKKLAGITLTGNDTTPVGKIELKTDGNNGLKLEQDMVPMNSRVVVNTPGTINLTGGQGIEINCSQSSFKMDQQGITLKVGSQAEIHLSLTEVVMKMGSSVACRLASDKAVLAWGPSQVVCRGSALELKGQVQRHG